MKKHFYLIFSLLIITFSCSKQYQVNKDSILVYESENLIIEKISENLYQHISYLQTNDFGKVDCNGMIVVDNGEAIVVDTPADAESSAELIQFISAKLNAKINYVVATHFHADCVGGLDEFHREKIPSISNQLTRDLLVEKNIKKNVPKVAFENIFEFRVGEKILRLEYFGEGHTKDNIVAYYPDEKTLFGGCLLKENGAGKGNLEDANEDAWSETVTKLKEKYPDIQTVIPGHGKRGGKELLDYTIELFQ